MPVLTLSDLHDGFGSDYPPAMTLEGTSKCSNGAAMSGSIRHVT